MNLLHRLLSGLQTCGEWFKDDGESLIFAVAEYMSVNGGKKLHQEPGVELEERKLSRGSYKLNAYKAHALREELEKAG